MTQLYEFWPLIASAAAFVALILYNLYRYRKMDAEAQKDAAEKAKSDLVRAVRDWLLKAVTDAEAAYGSGTGKIKIRAVYESMVDTFGPAVTSVITLDQLDDLVQMPLAEMRKLLESNAGVKEIVENGGAAW